MDNDKNKKPRLEINAITGVPEIIFPLTEEDAKLYKAREMEFIREPKQQRDLLKKILPYASLLPRDYLGSDKENHKWKLPNEGIASFPIKEQYKIERKNRELIPYIPTPPKLVEKNLDALAGLLQKANVERARKGEEKVGELEFSFKEYALARGYSEEEVARSGGFIVELKRDLISGGKTTYSVPIKRDGKNYIRHGFPSFYILDEPLDRKGKWYMSLNEPYRSLYLQEGQFYPVLTGAIKDRSTDGSRKHLYAFHKLIMSHGGVWKGRRKPALKVSTLLKDIRVGSHTQERPQESFNALRECIEYGQKLISEVSLKSKGQKKINLSPETFLAFSYEDFKAQVLAPLGLEDIRKALIGFERERLPRNTEDKGEGEGGKLETEKGGYL